MESERKLEDDNGRHISRMLVTCYLCKEIYKNPKLLSCYHSFCENCISSNTPEQGLTHHCPLCGSQSILPEEGAFKLKKNRCIDRLIKKINNSETKQTKTKMSEYGSDLHSSGHDDISPASSDGSPAGEDSIFASADYQVTCHVHEDRAGVKYCRRCHLVMCSECAKSNHNEHAEFVDSMEVMSEECERIMLEQVTALEVETGKLSSLLENISDVMEMLEENTSSAKREVNSQFEHLEKLLCERKGKLLREIENIAAKKEKQLKDQSVFIEKCIENLEDGISLVNDLTAFADEDVLSSTKNEGTLEDYQNDSLHNRNGDIDREDEKTTARKTKAQQTFLLHKQISNHLDDLNNNVYYDIEKNCADSLTTIPMENCHIEFQTCQNINKIHQILPEAGSIVSCKCRPEMCCVSGECLTTGKCFAKQENSIVLIAKNAKGEVDSTGEVPISVALKLIEIDEKAIRARKVSESKAANKNSTLHASSPRLNKSVTSPRIKEPVDSNQRVPLKDMFFRNSPVSNSSGLVRRTPKKNSLTKNTFNESHTLAQVTHIHNGSYEISLCPKDPGKYELSINVCDTPISQSPFTLYAVYYDPNTSLSKSSSDLRQKKSVRQRGMKRPGSATKKQKSIENDLLLSIGAQGRNDGDFTNPQGISLDYLGRLLVADSTNQSVQVFAIKGSTEETMRVKYIYKFGQKGRNAGQVQRPTGVLGLQDGRIAVADYDNKVVLFFNQSGTCTGKIGAGKLLGPKGICMDKNGHLVVVDNKLCEIFIFQLNGKLITRFGSRGNDEKHLAGPHYVTVDEENNLFVTDFYNHCVKVFTTSGDYLGSIGTPGEGCGQFNAPTGIAIDASRHLIVADWGNSRIQIFDKEGSFVAYVNTSENPLYGPQDVAVTKSGQIIVADAGNHCVKIYKYLQ